MNRTDSEEFIIGCIFLLSNKLNQIGDNILSDITFKQFILLITIHKMDIAKTNINNIADIMGTTRQNIKKMLSSLEKKGYVTMSRSKYDARAFEIALTDKTLQYFSDNADNAAYKAHLLFNSFSNNEINTFVGILNKLLNDIDNYAERANCDE